MKYFPKVVGERLYLSPMNVEDVETYTRWINDLPTGEGLGNAARVTTLEDERDWLLNGKGQYQFAIVEKETDRLLGNCGLQNFSLMNRSAEAGIFIGEESTRGKGYGAQALKLLLGYGFDYLNLHSIMLRVFSFNARAMRCYEKVGFRECGRRREFYRLKGQWYDEVYMDILEEEWRAAQAK
ncbi:MAG: GNAT family protein [Eubacteriales bacterium]|nr:GNAT family protein [Eubacteriales bacterium]